MRRRIIVTGLGLALAFALGASDVSFAAGPDSAAVDAPQSPPAKRTRLSAPT